MADQSQEQDNPVKEDYTSKHETITSVARISAILRPLMDKHTLVSASIPNSSKFFNTALLKVDPDNNLIVIDELIPKEGHDLLLKTKRTSLHISNEGVDINFPIDLKNAGVENGIAYYEFEFPQNLRYLQRRSAYRVPVSAANEIAIEITGHDTKKFQGELHDISTGGMCIRFPRKKDLPLSVENGEVRCKITLLNKQKINCTFNIRHACVNKANNSLHVGGNFINLDKVQRRAIEKFVVELQRKVRQKMSRQ